VRVRRAEAIIDEGVVMLKVVVVRCFWRRGDDVVLGRVAKCSEDVSMEWNVFHNVTILGRY
jgi:hypothetical protein